MKFKIGDIAKIDYPYVHYLDKNCACVIESIDYSKLCCIVRRKDGREFIQKYDNNNQNDFIHISFHSDWLHRLCTMPKYFNEIK